MSTTREESADCCQRREEGQCGSEEENRELTQVDTSQHEVIKIIGLQSPFRIKTRLSCTLEDEKLQDEAEGEDESQNSSASSGYSGEECAEEMLSVGGIIYHLEEINSAIINTMTAQELSLYTTLLAEYNTCYI